MLSPSNYLKRILQNAKQSVANGDSDGLQFLEFAIQMVLIYEDIRKAYLYESSEFPHNVWINMYKFVVTTLGFHYKFDILSVPEYPRYFISKHIIHEPRTHEAIGKLLGFNCHPSAGLNPQTDRVAHQIIEINYNIMVTVEVCGINDKKERQANKHWDDFINHANKKLHKYGLRLVHNTEFHPSFMTIFDRLSNNDLYFATQHRVWIKQAIYDTYVPIVMDSFEEQKSQQMCDYILDTEFWLLKELYLTNIENIMQMEENIETPLTYSEFLKFLELKLIQKRLISDSEILI